MADEKIFLRDDLFLGTGMHKTVYAHTDNQHLCIKILHTTPDPDLDREFRYRKALGDKANLMTLLTKYFGEVETSKGKGYLFERVIDYDGSTSKTMLELLNEAIADKTKLPALEKILLDFKRTYFAEKISLAGIDPDNYLVQKISPTECRVRIIDNIGTSAAIPIAYYFEMFAKKRAVKYWKKFVADLGKTYHLLFTAEFLSKLGDLNC